MTVLALPERRWATPALLNHYTEIDDDHLLGVIYLLHFVDPATGRHVRFGHAGHYLGWTHDLDTRMAKHGTHDGAVLMRHVRNAGIEWQIGRLWTGTRKHERRLKTRGQTRYCPLCNTRRRRSHTEMDGLALMEVPARFVGKTSPFPLAA
jgi:hypothetical protein